MKDVVRSKRRGRSSTGKNSLTAGTHRDIITAGRDDASGKASPLCYEMKPPTSQRWMAALTLLLMVSDMNRKSHSDNHENNREHFVIGHDHHLPLYGRGKSQAPSISFLPGTRGSINIISQRYVCVKLCFVMAVISPAAGRWPFFICPSFVQKRSYEPLCIWAGNGSRYGVEEQGGGKA